MKKILSLFGIMALTSSAASLTTTTIYTSSSNIKENDSMVLDWLEIKDNINNYLYNLRQQNNLKSFNTKLENDQEKNISDEDWENIQKLIEQNYELVKGMSFEDANNTLLNTSEEFKDNYEENMEYYSSLTNDDADEINLDILNLDNTKISSFGAFSAAQKLGDQKIQWKKIEKVRDKLSIATTSLAVISASATIVAAALWTFGFFTGWIAVAVTSIAALTAIASAVCATTEFALAVKDKEIKGYFDVYNHELTIGTKIISAALKTIFAIKVGLAVKAGTLSSLSWSYYPAVLAATLIWTILGLIDAASE